MLLNPTIPSLSIPPVSLEDHTCNLDQLFDRLSASQNKKDNLSAVLKKNAPFFDAENSILATVHGVHNLEIQCLVTKIRQQADVIWLEPSTVSEGSQIANLLNSLIVRESEMRNYVPDLDKLSYSAFGRLTPLERLKNLTEKGKFWFHSAKGRNFLATRVGIASDEEPFYRLYEFCVEQGKPLTLHRPSQLKNSNFGFE